MDFYQENNKEQEQKISYNENNRKNMNYIGKSEINTPISKKMITENNIYSNRIVKPLKTFVYKSIIHNDENINNNNFASNDISSNKKYYAFNLANQKIKKQMISNRNQQDYNYYNNNTYELDINNNILNNEYNNTNIINLNNIGKLLINDIKYNKQYSSQKENQSSTYSSIINSNNDNFLYIMNSGESLNFHKSEDNLNKKNLIQSQKEINGFELRDENYKYSTDNYRNIICKGKTNFGEEKIKNINKINLLNRNAKTNINDEINKEKNNLLKRLNTSPNINNYKSHNINYININKKNCNKMNKRNISVSKKNSSLYNLSYLKNKEENKTMQISKMTTTYNNIITQNNNFEIKDNPSLYSNNLREKYNNYILSPNNNNYSSISSAKNLKSVLNNKQKQKKLNSYNNIDTISNNNIDLFIQNKMKNYNNSTDYNIKLDDLNNEYYKSVKSNNIIMNKIYDDNKSNKSIKIIKTLENKSSHHSRIEFKDNTDKLKNEINKKNIIIENYLKIINEYKLKIDKLLNKNKELLEDSKKNQDVLIKQIKIYQNEICNLKRNNYHLTKINNNRKNYSINIIKDNINNIYSSNSNRNTNYINQINELKKQIENYKVENNNLKIMLIKTENNNNMNNNNGEQSLARDSSMKIMGIKSEKRSNSVSKSKTKLRISISLKKNYEEDKTNE